MDEGRRLMLIMIITLGMKPGRVKESKVRRIRWIRRKWSLIVS